MVTTSDFIGKFEVAVNTFSATTLQSYIDRYESKFATELLGKELYNLWVIAPNITPYDTITNPITFQDSYGDLHESLGIKDMLTGFIYFMYTRDIESKQSIGGAVKKANENSTQSTSAQSFGWQRYGESVESYKAIQEYICENLDVYPTFKGIEKEYIIPYF